MMLRISGKAIHAIVFLLALTGAEAQPPPPRDLHQMLTSTGYRHALRNPLLAYKRAPKNRRPKAYRRLLQKLEQVDPAVGAALKQAGLDAKSLTQGRSLSVHLRQLETFLSGARQADNLSLNHITRVHYNAKNQRWGFLGRRLRLSAGKRRYKKRCVELLARFRDSRLLDGAQLDALRGLLDRRLETAVAETKGKRFPEKVDLKPGSKRWWRWMGRFSQVASLPYSKIDLLVDGPQWRKQTHQMVSEAQGFLHIAAWIWKYDEAGSSLADEVIARKLSMSVEGFRKLHRNRSVQEIRDLRLTEEISLQRKISTNDAGALVKTYDEAQKRQLVEKYLDPLEVRVLLGSLVQMFESVGTRQRKELLQDLERVGARVITDNRVFSKKFPFVSPQHMWAMVPHAKMVISGNKALTGGMNIGNEYMQKTNEPLVWHDAAVRVEGEIVSDLNRSFVRHWNRATKKRGIAELPIDEWRHSGQDTGAFYYPKPVSGDSVGKAMLVGTDDLVTSAQTRYSHRTALMTALATAQKGFRMVVPYLSSPVLVKQLVRTAERFKREGKDPAKIQVTITGQTDAPMTGAMFTNHFLYAMDQAGITVRQWSPGTPESTKRRRRIGERKKKRYTKEAIHHAKIWVVDDKVAYLGSANATVRSLVQDWEVGLMSDDPAFVKKVVGQIFSRDAEYARPVQFLPRWKRAIGYGLSMLFGPVLRLL